MTHAIIVPIGYPMFVLPLCQIVTLAIIVPIDYPIFVLHLHQIVTPAIIVPYLTPDIPAITVPVSIHLYYCSIYAKEKASIS